MSQILIVDDDSGMTVILKEVFLGSNYEVMVASCVADAFDILAEHSVDLLITDMVMPGANGVELIDAVKSTYPELKVIAISGGDESRADGRIYLRAAKDVGADHGMLKPFRLDELVALAKEVIGEVA